MSTTTATIRSVKARAVVAPISRPVKNAFGIIEAAPLVLIDVATDQGVTGHSYIFAYTKLTLAPLVHLIEQIGRDLAGKAIAPFDLMAAMDIKFRLLGWQGLVGMAVSGLDMAFWDALGQVAGQPLAQLLGGSAWRGGAGGGGKPPGPCQGPRNLACFDSVRRELVVSARLCRSDRLRRQRL